MSGSLGPWADARLTASWRGVPFAVRESGLKRGRRTAVHEYAMRDDVWVEDLGRATQITSFRGFVTGDDVDQQMQALVAAAETPGDGTLVHPVLGALTGSLIEFDARDSAERGRVWEVEFVFITSSTRDAGGDEADTQGDVDDAADDAEDAVDDDFDDDMGDGFSGVLASIGQGIAAGVSAVADVVSDVVDDVVGTVGDVVDGVVGAVGDVVDGVVGAVGDAVDGVVGAVGDVVGGVIDAAGDVVDGIVAGVGDAVNGFVDLATDSVADAQVFGAAAVGIAGNYGRFSLGARLATVPGLDAATAVVASTVAVASIGDLAGQVAEALSDL